jgi:hypothetical protein
MLADEGTCFAGWDCLCLYKTPSSSQTQTQLLSSQLLDLPFILALNRKR